MTSIFSEKDRQRIKEQGLTEARVLAQMEFFRQGIPPIRLKAPCIVRNGIQTLSEAELNRLAAIYSREAAKGRALKFVPASGTASRMFQTLQTTINHGGFNADLPASPGREPDPGLEPLSQVLNNLKRFAFYDDLCQVLSRNGVDPNQPEKHVDEIIHFLLDKEGLNYAQLPKALIKFHKYGKNSRTSLEEHLVEAQAYAMDRNGVARVHFTVSRNHFDLVEKHIDQIRPACETSGARFEITLSLQKPSTDTIAVTHDHKPFRDRHGNILFRPGGHGALLENLNDLKGDIIFIKNIDNVSPDRLKRDAYIYKKALAGRLIELQEQVFAFLRILGAGRATSNDLEQALKFIATELLISPPAELSGGPNELAVDYLISILNRPIRVCGMVPNSGEPGGGPFWVEDESGRVTPQIVESSQMDPASDSQRAIFQSSTHFNPVDIVCGVRDYQGYNFNLPDFRDERAGFISTKSAEGRELKALELPGLWNGAMARWLTVFVEVPLFTFTPVKTINDLLRPEHQP